MKPTRWLLLMLAVAPLAAGASLHAQGADQDVFQAVRHYDFQHRTPVATIYQMIRDAKGDKAKFLEIETKLSEVLDDPQTTLGAREEVCRMLWEIGTAQSVPSVAKMLTDDKLCNPACYALQRNTSLAAGKALRDAVGKATGRALVAVVNALGDRRDVDAVAVLTPLASSNDAELHGSVIAALGKIGTPDALKVLLAETDRTPLVDQALLTCASHLATEGHVNEAMPVYDQLLADKTSSTGIRIGAQHLALVAQGAKAIRRTMELLEGDDLEMRAVAIRYIREAPGSSDFSPVIETLSKLPPASQALLIRALTERGDRAVLPVLIGAAQASDSSVKLAALQGFANVEGNAAAVALLTRVAARDTEDAAVRDAARAGLARMRGAEVDQAILKAIQDADSAAKAELALCLRFRGDHSATPLLFKLARSTDEAVQAAAFTSLGSLARAEDYPAAEKLVLDSKTETQRTAAETLAISLSRLVQAGPDRTARLIAGFPEASEDTKASIFRALSGIGGDDGLKLVDAERNDASAPIQDAAVRALCAWPDSDPLADVISIAKTDPNQVHQVLAIRGAVRLVGLSDRPAAEKIQLLQGLLIAAHRSEDRKLVLAGMAEVGDVIALKTLLTYLDDENLREDAASSAVVSGRNLGVLAGSALKPSMQKVIDTAKTADTVQKAKEVLANADRVSRGWRVLGPFPFGTTGFDKEYGPEKNLDFNKGYTGTANGQTARWKFAKVDPNGYVNLLPQFDPNQDVVIYAAVYVKSPEARKAIFSMGSDDGIRAWLNGKDVWKNPATRPATPGEDKAPVNLNAGWNAVLLKITQVAGDWGYYFDILDANSQPLTDITYAAVPD